MSLKSPGTWNVWALTGDTISSIMLTVKKRKLLERILSNPHNVRFSDFCRAMESTGFCFHRQKGSHRIYFHDAAKKRLVVQPDKGMAKGYQVKQFVALLEELGEI